MVTPFYDPRFCAICKRALDHADDPLGSNCGGDCLACMIETEDGRTAPELPPEQLALWLDLRSDIEAKLTDRVLDCDRGPLAPDERFEGQDAFTVDWVARFEAIGITDSAAWSLVRHTMRTVWPS